MSTQHTAGPWTIEEYGDSDTPALVIHRDSENRICFMATAGSRGDPEAISADARLIAAAPDLLVALRRFLATINPGNADSHSKDCGCVIHEARAAIAKAEGRT